MQVLKGILKNMPDMGIPDLISAPLMAREAGIESHISQVKDFWLRWWEELNEAKRKEREEEIDWKIER